MTTLERSADVSAAELNAQLDQLDREGFLLIRGALTPEETEQCRARINHAREQGWQEGLNEVGDMWFDSLLERDPETFRPLIAHPSVRPYLEALMGPQCQLRSLRAHINPGPIFRSGTWISMATGSSRSGGCRFGAWGSTPLSTSRTTVPTWPTSSS